MNERSAEGMYAYRAAMNDFRLDPSTTVLIVVDMQNGSCDDACGWIPAYTELGYSEIMAAYRARMLDQVVPNVARLERAFREVGTSVIFLTVGTIVGDLSDMPARFRRSFRYWQSLGIQPPHARWGTREMAVMDAIAPVPGEPVIPKTGYSGFTASPLERVLFSRGARQIVFCGVATDACVEATLRDAVDRGFDCVLADDACTSATPASHERGVLSIGAFARILSTEAVSAEIVAARPAATGAR